MNCPKETQFKVEKLALAVIILQFCLAYFRLARYLSRKFDYRFAFLSLSLTRARGLSALFFLLRLFFSPSLFFRPPSHEPSLFSLGLSLSPSSAFPDSLSLSFSLSAERGRVRSPYVPRTPDAQDVPAAGRHRATRVERASEPTFQL